MPPPMTPARQLLRAIRTGKTDATEALDTLFKDPGHLQEHLNFPDLDKEGAVDTLQDWATAELRRLGLGMPHFIHIDDWPRDQKEQVRQALVEAIREERTVTFRWELHDGYAEETRIEPGGTGDVSVTFRSPERKVRGEVHVDV